MPNALGELLQAQFLNLLCKSGLFFMAPVGTIPLDKAVKLWKLFVELAQLPYSRRGWHHQLGFIRCKPTVAVLIPHAELFFRKVKRNKLS